jgi:hypothetical protein
MRFWMVAVTLERYDGERLYAYDTITLPGATDGPAEGDLVALAAAGEPAVLFGLGRVLPTQGDGDGDFVVGYTHRLFDDARPLTDAVVPGLRPVDAAEYAALAAGVTGLPERTQWFVSVALPIEAASRAEAVREFWTYVEKLGPQQLPAYVWPRGDELALQAYLLGEETNLDPEEED